MGKPSASPSLKWTGTKGNDTAFVTSREALGNGVYDGAAGYDTLDLSGITSGGVSLFLNAGNPAHSLARPDWEFHGSWWTFIQGPVVGSTTADTIKNFEKIVGTGFNDYFEFVGGSINRVVDAGAGDDAIYMGSSVGTNTAIGGVGHDQLFGNRPTDILVGGTYFGNAINRDGVSDEFTMYAGTIRDFEPGIDVLYIDASNLPGQATSAVWTTYGNGARLTIAADRAITVEGVSAATMNASPKGYLLATVNGGATSGTGDDFISANNSPGADHFTFGDNSGHDELVGYNVSNDSLEFYGDDAIFSQVSYHGDTALLATYDGGASSVLLIGLSSADIPNLHIDPWG